VYRFLLVNHFPVSVIWVGAANVVVCERRDVRCGCWRAVWCCLVLSGDVQCCLTLSDDVWYYIVPYGAVKYSLVLFVAVW
jgi:hypothetical protein